MELGEALWPGPSPDTTGALGDSQESVGEGGQGWRPVRRETPYPQTRFLRAQRAQVGFSLVQRTLESEQLEQLSLSLRGCRSG